MATMIEDLVKHFAQTTALKKIDIKIQEGDIIASLGTSGWWETPYYA